MRNRPPVEDAVAEVAENDGSRRCLADLLGQLLDDRIGDRAIVQRVDLEHPIVAAHEGVLVRGRAGMIQDRLGVDARLAQALQHEILEAVLAEDGGEGYLGTGGAHVLGDDCRATDIVYPVVEADAWGRRLRHAADHGGVREAVDDRVADDMHLDALEGLQCLTQPIEADPLGLHQGQQLVQGKIGRAGFDEGRGRENDIAGREQNLATEAREHVQLLLRLRVDAAFLVLVSLGVVFRLDASQIVQRRRILVDHHVVDGLQRRQIEGAQILGHEGPVMRLGDVRVGCDARDQDVRLALGVEQMSDMARMHEVEDTVAHHDGFLARARSDEGAKLLDGDDLVSVLGGKLVHYDHFREAQRR